MWSISLIVFPSLEYQVQRCMSRILNHEPIADNPFEPQNDSIRKELSFTIPDPKLPTTDSIPALSVPVTAFRSPRMMSWSCGRTDAVAVSRSLNNVLHSLDKQSTANFCHWPVPCVSYDNCKQELNFFLNYYVIIYAFCM